ncbi:MAG TPA: hypothetical protein V6C85_12140 [Allocoleopsis sp.]
MSVLPGMIKHCTLEKAIAYTTSQCDRSIKPKQTITQNLRPAAQLSKMLDRTTLRKIEQEQSLPS